MRGIIQDLFGTLIGWGIAVSGAILTFLMHWRMRSFHSTQQRLRKRYGIQPQTPILKYGAELKRLIRRAAQRSRGEARYAHTSGTTEQPKRIPYSRRRVRLWKSAYFDFFARCCWALSLRRKSLYIFSSWNDEGSLSSLLLEEKKLPSYLSTLQAPHRVERDAALQQLRAQYGGPALRLWVLAIANPGVLFAVNPSMISTFLDRLCSDWPASTALIRDFVRQPERFDARVRWIARRLASRGCDERLQEIAASAAPLPFSLCAPGVKAYLTWDGGYVRPFLDRIAAYLPPERYRHVPMYSMSTECIETTGHFIGDRPVFLPLATGVLYEFLEEGTDDRPGNLRLASELRPGERYTLVVSDPYGLRRYQTDDLFRCRGVIYGLPDLSFEGRRALEYSFTGEKVTAEQCSLVFEHIRRKIQPLAQAAFLTCIPSQPLAESVPHYKVVLVGINVALSDQGRSCISRLFHQRLGEINPEYRGKVESGRLGAPRIVCRSFDAFVRMAAGRVESAQFKFLPLYRRTWESFEAPARMAQAS